MRYRKSTRSTTVTQKLAAYLIECEICGEQYTGSTKQSLGLGRITIRVLRESL